MIIEKLISMLDTELDSLSESWIKLLKENENTEAYQRLDDRELHEFSRFVYHQLKLWLDWQITSAELATLFWKVGIERKTREFPLSDIFYAMVLARRNLYINIIEKIGEGNDADLNEIIEFTGRITYFFDKIAYFVIKGYEGSAEPTAEDQASLNNVLDAFRAGTHSV